MQNSFLNLNISINKHKKYLSTSIKENSSYKKEQFLFNEMKKKFGKNYDPKDFINRLQRLGEIYVQGPGRYEVELYKKIKAPLNYKNSMLQKNLMGIATRSFLGVVAKAKMLGLPKNQIQLLEDVLGGSKALTKMHIAGDHTDIDALMKMDLKNYKKDFTRINIISHKLNNIKLASDQKLISLVKSFNAGLIQPDEFKQKVQEIRTKFTNKTKIPISNPQIKGGKIVLDFQTPRLIDLNNPRNKAILSAMNNLVKEGVKFKGIDQELMFANTIKERFNILKNAGIDQLKNSKYIKAFAEMSGEVGKAANTILKAKSGKVVAGVTLYSLLSTIASASEKEEIETGDQEQEASVMGDVASAVAENPIKSAAAVIGGDVALNKAKLSKGALNALGKVIGPFAMPGVQGLWETGKAIVNKELPGMPDMTSPMTWMTPAFWEWGVSTWGFDKTLKNFGKTFQHLSKGDKARVVRNVVARAGLKPEHLLKIRNFSIPWIAATTLGYVAKESQPNLFRDEKTGDLKMKDEQITPLFSNMIKDYNWRFQSDDFFEKEYGIKKEDYKSNLPEFLDLEKKRREDVKGLDYARGGIASLLK
jgi:hypothetical protein